MVIDEDDRRDGESPSQQNRKGLLIYCFSLTDKGLSRDPVFQSNDSNLASNSFLRD